MTTFIKSVAQAMRMLTPPLKFGDAEQLRAVKFIEKVQECADVIRKCVAAGHPQGQECWKCKGHGACSKCEEECGTCDGTGEVDGCKRCLRDWPDEVTAKALAVVEADFQTVLTTGQGLY